MLWVTGDPCKIAVNGFDSHTVHQLQHVNTYMAKQTVYIFGDSYAEAKESRKHHMFEYSWPRKLETIFDVRNYAVGGSGPQDVCTDLHKLIQVADCKELKQSVAIIVFPDISRYNFSFYQKRNHSVYGQLNSLYTQDHYFVEDFLNYYSKDKLEFVVNFKRYYLEHAENWAIEEAKYLSYFDNIATSFKQTLIWPVNPLLTSDRYQHIDIAPIDLETVAKHEQQGNIDLGIDKRLNHISIDNHNVMTEQLYNWIVDRKQVEDRFLKE